MRCKLIKLFLLIASLVLWPQLAQAQETQEKTDEVDIDDFMSKVLEKRSLNWDKLYDYVFSEREIFEFKGNLLDAPLLSFRREWRWYVRDGYMVRSPVTANGVRVNDEEREKYELEWIERAKKREKKGDRSLDREQFFGFDFDPGNYYFAGNQMIGKHEVAVIEYYPEAFYADGDGPWEENDIERKMDKSTLVVMYVDPVDYQMVKMTMNTFKLDFIPAGWLVKVSGIEGSMEMDKPLDNNWMPVFLGAKGKIEMATGALTFEYKKEFYDYSQTKVRVKFRFAPRSNKEN